MPTPPGPHDEATELNSYWDDIHPPLDRGEGTAPPPRTKRIPLKERRARREDLRKQREEHRALKNERLVEQVRARGRPTWGEHLMRDLELGRWE
ncbi:hypothetical protein WME77_19150 [Sorangium sp. So ce764]|uniref:hypothetical protein n=1 Tax=Sorangium sp. So ce764 TaxID=3133320 RepID=UPI003F5EFF81